MNSPPAVTVTSFTSASCRHRSTGLLGWLTIEIGGLVIIDGITLRRTANERLSLSFPRPRSARGEQRPPIARPSSNAARVLIEREVLVALEARSERPL